MAGSLPSCVALQCNKGSLQCNAGPYVLAATSTDASTASPESDRAGMGSAPDNDHGSRGAGCAAASDAESTVAAMVSELANGAGASMGDMIGRRLFWAC